MAGGLDGAALVDIDVAGISAQHTLPRPQHRGDHRQVGLGAAHQEMNIDRLVLAQGADSFSGALAVGILSITGGLFLVGLQQPLQNGGMGAGVVIAFKADHDFSSSLGSSSRRYSSMIKRGRAFTSL